MFAYHTQDKYLQPWLIYTVIFSTKQSFERKGNISSYHATETFSGHSNTNLTVETYVLDTQILISLLNICYGHSNTNLVAKTNVVDTQMLISLSKPVLWKLQY